MNALILVDLQNDFVSGGALAVANGSEVVPLANQLQAYFEKVVATQDWHPLKHESFAQNQNGYQVGEQIDLHGLPQVLWPVHCVQNSEGAAFVDELDTEKIDRVFRKGTDPTVDSYSGFFDNGHRKETGLGDYLQSSGVRKVFIMGLATDYCVKFTALDAVSLGFETYLIEDACRGVNLQAGDIERAVEEMRAAGVYMIRSEEILNRTL